MVESDVQMVFCVVCVRACRGLYLYIYGGGAQILYFIKAQGLTRRAPSARPRRCMTKSRSLRMIW